MRFLPKISAILLLVTFAGCSSNDDPAGPGPAPTGPPSIQQFLATATNPLKHGDTTKLVWNVTNARTVVISPDVGAVSAVEGSVTIRPHETTTYTLTASNEEGSDVATFTTEIRYLPGLYVSGISGDDANDGLTPVAPLKSLSEALTRAGAGAAIFLAGGTATLGSVYTTAVTLNSSDVSIYGGRDPFTFFEDPANFPTVIRPGSGIPLWISKVITHQQYSHLRFEAGAGSSHAVRLTDAGAIFDQCIFDASSSETGVAVLLEGASFAEIHGSRVLAGRDLVYLETTAIQCSDASSLLASNCFIDGGQALNVSLGVDARGSVRLGFNTIVTEVTSSGTNRIAAAVRVSTGAPALGGNIFVGRGPGQRVGVEETAPGRNPSWLEGNLFVGMSQPPYINADGESPTTQEQLNSDDYTTGNGATVGGNLWPQGVSAASLFENLDAGDFHLVNPTTSGDQNPAVNAGDTELGKEEYGGAFEDIDQQRRPTTGHLIDLGADEIR